MTITLRQAVQDFAWPELVVGMSAPASLIDALTARITIRIFQAEADAETLGLSVRDGCYRIINADESRKVIECIREATPFQKIILQIALEKLSRLYAAIPLSDLKEITLLFGVTQNLASLVATIIERKEKKLQELEESGQKSQKVQQELEELEALRNIRCTL